MAGPVKYHLGKFPPADLEWPRLIPLLGPASAALAQYDALLPKLLSGEVMFGKFGSQEKLA